MSMHNYFYDSNISIVTLRDPFRSEITEACFNWCKEQHFAQNTNLEIEILFLPALALMSLIISELIKDTKYNKWQYNFLKFSKWLLIFFFGLFFYRYYF